MGDDSAGPGPPPPPDERIAPGKRCLTSSSNKPISAVGRGNHHYCEDCKKARSSPAPSQHKGNQKRDNPPLSPIEQNQLKLPKGDKSDEFAFAFDSAFGCDLDTLLELDRSKILAKFKNHFRSIQEQSEIARSENDRLSEQIQALKLKLNTAKLAFADKFIKHFESGTTGHPADRVHPIITQALRPPSQPSPTPTRPADNRPTLVAWLRKGVTKSDVPVDKVDSNLDLDSDGPVVQQFKKTEHRVTLTFKDALDRDRAKDLINCSQQNIFQSVSVQQKTYPAVARLNGLSDIRNITVEADLHEKRRLRCAAILKALKAENPALHDGLISVRILSNRSSSCSFHVR